MSTDVTYKHVHWVMPISASYGRHVRHVIANPKRPAGQIGLSLRVAVDAPQRHVMVLTWHSPRGRCSDCGAFRRPTCTQGRRNQPPVPHRSHRRRRHCDGDHCRRQVPAVHQRAATGRQLRLRRGGAHGAQHALPSRPSLDRLRSHVARRTATKTTSAATRAPPAPHPAHPRDAPAVRGGAGHRGWRWTAQPPPCWPGCLGCCGLVRQTARGAPRDAGGALPQELWRARKNEGRRNAHGGRHRRCSCCCC